MMPHGEERSEAARLEPWPQFAYKDQRPRLLMSSKPERIEFLQQHLFYELQMLRFAHSNLLTENDVLHWNAMFESFCVHARNMHEF